MTLRLENVSKSYDNVRAVQNISFSCESGTITGFIGPNGSGKSTTLRMIAGLTRLDEGSISIAGTRFQDLANPGREIGFLLDPSAHHPGRSVRETVGVAAIMMGLPFQRVDAAVESVGLAGAARRKVRSLSLGMRQRLSLAIALLGSPRYLVLDEPANGLDVEGMGWLKASIRAFVAGGGAVLISSHLLNELESYVDRVVIIDRGQVLSNSSMRELGRTDMTEVDGPERQKIQRILQAEGLVIVGGAGACVQPIQVASSPEQVGEILWRHGVQVSLLHRKQVESLESYYSELTSPEFAAVPAVKDER
ncbi:ABC transporter ATP-binding protein [Arthrobacter ramosus]|uniref:ABC transporter ATP-binding protein n=1 Tax=Arthrobacter ramosus TaxID=1672 RepID=A0ABV5XZ06_ARTRM|nr:ATP-binding cassette domain-containing protein [Arthrobacter ramosus]